MRGQIAFWLLLALLLGHAWAHYSHGCTSSFAEFWTCEAHR